MATERICVYGIVQGVGFRPFVSRIADRIGILGSVANRGSYVEIFAAGNQDQLAAFHKALRNEAPERSTILKITAKDLEQAPSYSSFEIIESERERGDIFVSPDIATCPKCKKELYDPSDRRYMHPFINCTACGPRLTILDAMPYDRERTSMKEFPMCPACSFEYTHAETRRYDAQPVCCNDCGPEVYLLRPGQDKAAGKPLEKGSAAITAARQAIMNGEIVAIKGIGGFHLCCDATNETAVARLRTMKRRPAKPFAVMMKNLETVERECLIAGGGHKEEVLEILDGHQKPIILLKRKKESALAPSVAPDNPKIGVMLPYAPVQMLLFEYNDGLTMTTDCFVMTSGNMSGAPICRTDEDALKELSGFCDVILSHNRTIRLRADDTVMDLYRGEPYMIRRSRGYAPLPIMTEAAVKGSVVGIGGELKNTFCVGKDQLLYPSPYVGDMADLRTVRALEESVARMTELLEAEPSLVVCDLHPKYNTTMVAERLGLPVLKLQHHYAHILSCMAENDVRTPVIGLSLDGTGYGTDQTIWGGELLLCDPEGFERLGYIRPFKQAGGDASAKEGWRIAVSMINSLYPEKVASEIVKKTGLCDEMNRKLIGQMAARGINTVTSTSAGRLFDAVSALLGVRKQSSFEGEASTTLQFRAEAYLEENAAGGYGEVPSYTCFEAETSNEAENTTEAVNDSEAENVKDQIKGGPIIMATDRLFSWLTEEYLKALEGTKDSDDTASLEACRRRLAYAFHAGFADLLVKAAVEASERTGLSTVALSGGVFQNTLLLGMVEDGLTAKGLKVIRHHLIPPNDGGLGLGQAFAGMHRLNFSK